MTIETFYALCLEKTLDPALVIENEEIYKALQEREDDRVIELMDSEF